MVILPAFFQIIGLRKEDGLASLDAHVSKSRHGAPEKQIPLGNDKQEELMKAKAVVR
jgi:hypothetical protein